MEHKPLDPARAPIIKRLFEMAATGEWSLADLSRWAVEQGFTMPPMRRRRTRDEILAEEEDDVRAEIEAIHRLPTFNTIHKILTNPFYAGRVLGNDDMWVASMSHEALVSETLFNEVQERLERKNKSAHYAELLDHPLRGIARCAVCRRLYTPYPKKGAMYYGARCANGCANPLKSFNFDYIAGKVGGLMATLSFTDEELEKLDATTNTDIALFETKRHSQLEAGERKKKRIREDLAYLNTNRLMLLKTGVYTAEGFVAEEARLSLELATLCEEEVVSDASMRETVKDIIILSELLKNAAVVYDLAKPHEKERILRVIFSELTLSKSTLDYKCKKGFAALQSRFVASCDPTGNRTPINGLKSRRPNR